MHRPPCSGVGDEYSQQRMGSRRAGGWGAVLVDGVAGVGAGAVELRRWLMV